ncbi:MAG: magnesium chelatase subunit ChlI family protein [Candidatus Binatia bacterium]
MLGKEDVDKFLTIAIDKQGFSAWLYNRILNFGRTSAHLTDSKNINAPHSAEALQYRSLHRII